MSIILDLIIVAIIILSTIFAVKKGFARLIFSVLGIVLAVFISFTINKPLADFSYDKLVYPAVSKAIEKTIDENINGTAEDLSNSVYSGLPEFITKNTDIHSIESLIDSEQSAETICNNIVKPTAITILRTIYSIILLIVLMFIFGFLAKVLSKLFNFSLVGKVNKTLGGVLGIVRGAAFSMVFIVAVLFLINITGGFLCFTTEAVEQSTIFNLFSKLLSINF